VGGSGIGVWVLTGSRVNAGAGVIVDRDVQEARIVVLINKVRIILFIFNLFHL
jgi:hypothetical protein